MSDQAQSPGSAKNRRSKYVLDPKWQLPVSSAVAFIAVVSGLLLFAGVYYIGTRVLRADDSVESLSGSQTAYIALIVNALYFLILAGLLFFLALRITHAVAGPAMVLERAVEALRTGRYDSRLKLRRGDYLKSLARSLERLTADMKRQEEQRERACKAIEMAVTSGDRATVRDLLDEIRGLQPRSPLPQPVPEKTAA